MTIAFGSGWLEGEYRMNAFLRSISRCRPYSALKFTRLPGIWAQMETAMTKKTFTVMALVLVAATALTAATAFAGSKDQGGYDNPAAVEKTVAGSNGQISLNLLRIKIKRKIYIRNPDKPVPPPPTTGEIYIPKIKR